MGVEGVTTHSPQRRTAEELEHVVIGRRCEPFNDKVLVKLASRGNNAANLASDLSLLLVLKAVLLAK
jgi:hypothetical protein